MPRPIFDDVVSVLGAASRLHAAVEACRMMGPAVLDSIRSGEMAPEVVGEMVASRLGNVQVNGQSIQRSTIVRFSAGLTALYVDLDRAQVFRRRGTQGVQDG